MTDEDVRKMATDLLKEIQKAKIALFQLETGVAILQTGDANGAYWTGENAYDFLRACITQLEQDTSLLMNLEKGVSYLENYHK